MKEFIVKAWKKIMYPGGAQISSDEAAPIMYWFPGAEIPEQIAGRLEKHMTKIYPATGPGGNSGTLCAPFDSMLAYNPELQNWKEQNGVWIGFRKDFEPSMVLRKSYKHFSGYSVVLRDEKAWIIPVAVPYSAVCSLPKVAKLNEKGKWESAVDERYQHISDAAAFIYENINDDGILERVSDSEAIQMASMAIAANYDISDFEISALNLLSDAAITGIFSALVDEQGLLEIIAHQSGKKKALGARSANNGNKV